MDPDELEPRARKPQPINLEAMSIDALKDYIAGLEGEIERARAVIGAKEKARAGADTFFKK